MKATQVETLLPEGFTLFKWEDGLVSIEHTLSKRRFADYIPQALNPAVKDGELRVIIVGWITNSVLPALKRKVFPCSK